MVEMAPKMRRPGAAPKALAKAVGGRALHETRPEASSRGHRGGSSPRPGEPWRPRGDGPRSLLREGGPTGRESYGREVRRWEEDAAARSCGDDPGWAAHVGYSRCGALPSPSMRAGLPKGVGGGRTSTRYQVSRSGGGPGRSGLGHKRPSGSPPKGGRERSSETASGSARARGGGSPCREKGGRQRRSRRSQKEERKGREKEEEAFKEIRQSSPEQVRKKAEREEEEEPQRAEFQRRRKREEVKEQCKEKESKGEEQVQLSFIERYRREASVSEEDVSGDSPGSVFEETPQDTP